MKVYKKNLYAGGGGAARKLGIVGELYVVQHNYSVHKVGCVYQGHVRSATEADFASIPNQDFTKWKQVPFSEMPILCQEKLITLLGSDFPFAESRWKTKEEWEEWDNPQTISGKISKSIRNSKFFRTWCKSDEWDAVKQVHHVQNKKRQEVIISYVENEGWFLEEIFWDKTYSEVVKARLFRMKEDDAKAIIQNSQAKSE